MPIVKQSASNFDIMFPIHSNQHPQPLLIQQTGLLTV